MLNKIKNVKKNRKLIIALMVILMVLGIYIKSEAIDITNGSIKPVYRPKWEIDKDANDNPKVYLNKSDKTLSIVLKGNAQLETQTLDGGKVSVNYESNVTSTLDEDDITVYINGVEAPSIKKPATVAEQEANADKIFKELTEPANKENVSEVIYTLTLSDFEDAIRLSGKPFKEWSGNISIKIAGRGEDSGTYDEDVLIETGYNGVNQSMMELDETGTWINITFQDDITKDKNTARDESITNITTTTPVYMFADFVKPEYTYEYSTTNPDINTGTETVTVVFDVTDKYFESTALSTDTTGSLIKVIVDDDEDANTPITKVLTRIKDVYYDATTNTTTYVEPNATGTGTKVGERYQLVITGLDQGDGFAYSGPLTLSFEAGAQDGSGNLVKGIRDKSGNLSQAQTITMGINEPGGNPDDDIVVDVVDPIWTIEGEPELETGIITLTAKDKYYQSSILTPNDITVYVNGEALDEITTTIVSGPTKVSDQEYEWVIRLSNITFDENAYVKFTPTNKTDDSLEEGINGFLYRKANDGDITIKIAAGAEDGSGNLTKGIRDESGNLSNEQTFSIGNFDKTKPEVFDVKRIQNPSANTETIIFNVTDRNYDSSDLVGIDNNSDGIIDDINEEIKLWIDNYSSDSNDDYYDARIKAILDNATLTYKEIKTQVVAGGTERVVGHQYTLVITNIAESSKQSGKDYLEYSGTLKIEIAENAITDNNDNNINTDTATLKDFVDYLKPQLKPGTHTINADKTYTMSFDIYDKYLDTTSTSSEITADEITVYIDGEQATAIAKPTTAAEQEANKDKLWIEIEKTPINTTSEINKTININTFEDVNKDKMFYLGTDSNSDGELSGTELTTGEDENGNLLLDFGTVTNDIHTIGQTYTVKLSNFEQSIKQTTSEYTYNKDFYEWSGTVKIEIAASAVEDTEGNTLDTDATKRTVNGEHVDFIKPRVEMVSKTVNTSAKTETIVFDVYDKYLDLTNLIGTDNTEPTDGTIDNLGSELIIKVDGEDATSNLTKTLTYTPLSNTINKTIDGTLYTNSQQNIGYRYTLVISGFEQASRRNNDDKAFKDYSGTVTVEIAEDAMKDTTANTLYNPATDIDDSLIDTSNVIADSNKVTLIGDFVDFINPHLQYITSESVIDKENDKYTMIFDITDKYYTSGQLTPADLTIMMYNGKSTVNLKSVLPTGSITLGVADKNATNVNYTETDGKVTASISSIKIGHTYTLTIRNFDKQFLSVGNTTVNYSGVITVAIPVDKILDRTVTYNERTPNEVTKQNGNVATTLTSSVTVENGGSSDNAEVVDTVKPLWKSTSTTAYAVGQTATIEFEGTDTYLKESTLASEDIKVYIYKNGVLEGDTNGNGKIDEGENPTVTKNLSDVIYITETRYVNSGWNSATNTATSTEEQVRYKAKYTLTLTGFDVEADQVKIEIPANTLEDKSGNKNIVTEIITYNVLKVAEQGETNDAQHAFLGGPSAIQRQNIENITFSTNGVTDAISAGLINVDVTGKITAINDETKCWDVSAQQDKSIIAWVTQTTAEEEGENSQETRGTYTVHIGSKWEIFANRNSSYLFKQIGASANCTATEAITNLERLNVTSVTDMSYMFRYFGYNAMTTFDLGDKFNTGNVTTMKCMFFKTGYKAMTSLDLSSETGTSNTIQFKTTSVVDMVSMFQETGVTAMEELKLGNNFDTSNVTLMQYMFYETGKTKLEGLNLGSKFNTQNVDNMKYMFYRCGQSVMTTLNLGSNFNTQNVSDMSYMFNECGLYLTSLDLGSLFNTANVENMSYMFYQCGRYALTQLNLGSLFNTSKVTDMERMFSRVGETTITSLNLGNLFDTSKVINMKQMFYNFGYNVTSLDLGDKFYTTSATNMEKMFNDCGKTAMTKLDLGQHFTKIASTYTDIFTGTGKSGCTIYAPEAIYKNKTAFKLNSTDTATDPSTDTNLAYTNGTINPIYRPEWTKTSSSINTTNKELTINLKGTASKTQTVDSNVTINYSSNVTSNLTTNDITVYVDGVEADWITKTLTATSGTTNVAEVTYALKLSAFEEATRQTVTGGALKKFDEWSGNVSILIDGRGEGTGTYTAGTLIDHSGSYSYVDSNDETVIVKNVAYDTSNNIIASQSMMELESYGTNPYETNEPSTDWDDITYYEAETDRNNTTSTSTMFTDFIKPEFTYISSETTVGDGNNGDTKIVTIKFYAADKYFDNANSSLALTDLDLYVYDRVAGGTYVQVPDSVFHDSNNTLTSEPLYDVDDATKRIGTTYTLTIKNLEQLVNDGYVNMGDGFTYSGPMAIQIPAGKIKDLSTNLNDAKLITVGVDDFNNTTQGSDTTPDQVDVVDPIWQVGKDGIQKTTTADGQLTITTELIVLDRYYKQNSLTKDDIKVMVDGVDISAITGVELTKTLTKKESASDETFGDYTLKANGDVYKTFDGTAEKVGERYEFVIANFKESDALFFAQRALYNDADATNGGRVYREYSGTMEIVIPADKAEDNHGNKNIQKTIPLNVNPTAPLNHIDTLVPEVIKVSGTKNINATNVELSTYTVVFDIVDKYMNTSSITTTDTSKIHVYLDGELTDVTKTITNIQTLTATVNGTPRTVGYRYTLELSQFEHARTSINYDRLYTDWSGDLSIKIDAGTAVDTSGQGNAETILYGNESQSTDKTKAEHVDYIKPDATYKYSEADVDNDNSDGDGKKFTMVFEITDKFYEEHLNVTDLQILMTAEEETGAGEDGYYNLMTNDRIGKNLQSVDITNDVIQTNETTGEQYVEQDKVIGRRYTLVITNLEQVQRIEGNYYLDYSGAITIVVPEGVVKDTSENGNNAISITSGIDIPGGEITDIESVDVVDPIWERKDLPTDTIDIHGKTATITIEGTDKYFCDGDTTKHQLSTVCDPDKDGTLTIDEIKLIVDGSEVTFAEGDIEISDGTKMWEQRIVKTEYSDGDVDASYTTETVQYGIQYTLTIKNFSTEASQVKIQLVQGSLIDQSGNESNPTEFLVYNALKTATNADGSVWETAQTSGFLGNNTISRQNIKQIVFANSTTGAPAVNSTSGSITTCWDVSALRDNSILAWMTDTTAPYVVYIGSNDDIYANKDSKYLFSYIGYASNTETNTISGLDKLDTRIVTNMAYMFQYAGHNAMTSLNLGATGINFDTRNVTDMSYMFRGTGYTAMASLDLGDMFDTSKVTNMSYMFYETGYTAMTSLDLSSGTASSNTKQFNTGLVTNMSYMFHSTGYTKMTSISLGNNFNTEKVTDMQYMFAYCGRGTTDADKNVTSAGIGALNLGSKFNTSQVTTMTHMFEETGYTAMTSLNLGQKFNTGLVIDMSYMFNGTGYKAMTSLDLSSGTDASNTTQFNTSSVTNMTFMFSGTGYTAMISLNLGTNFNTGSVTNMSYMFYSSGYTAMTSLDLSSGTGTSNTTQFNTSSVTNMKGMFFSCGHEAMTTLKLGYNFDTNNVTDMGEMFRSCGIDELTSLDLGDKFDTTNVTNMHKMFEYCGYAKMTALDLGPRFTKIPSGTFVYEGSTVDVYDEIVEYTGKSGACTIYAPEAIYKNKNAFKLHSTDGDNSISYTRGTINPIYKPNWEVVTATNNTTAKSLTIVLRGYAYETNASAGVDAATGININYASDVTSIISSSNFRNNIQIFIDGVEVTNITNPNKSLATTTQTNESSGKTEVIHTLTLNNFEEAIRQTLADGSYKKFDEWSGNVTLKIKGRGDNISTYNANVLKESTGNYNAVNQNMSQTDETGTWVDIEFKDGQVNRNTDDTMFADFIKPEFTYQWSETVVDQDNKILTVVFYAADRYLDKDNSGLQLSNFYNPETDASSDGKPIFKVDGTAININVAGNSLTQEDEETETGTVLKYTLVVKNLPKSTGDNGQANPYNNYSGPVTITIPADKFVDYSGNKNDAKTITIGINEYNNTTQNGSSSDKQIVDLVDPEIMLTQVAEKNVSYLNTANVVNRTSDTITVKIRATDKYLWKGVLEDNVSSIKVKVVKPDGTVIENVADSSIPASSRVNFAVEKIRTTTELVEYNITLSNFGDEEGELEGITSIIIPAGVIQDYGKNGVPDTPEVPNINAETEIFIGTINANGIFTAENTSIADFVDPTWEYTTSSITRDRAGEVGTVTLDIFGYDSYLFRDYLDTSKIKVLINGEEVPSIDIAGTGIGTKITKSLSAATYYDGSDTITGLTETKTYNSTNNQGVTETQSYEISKGNGVKYTLTLGNFGTYEGKVSIVIDGNTIQDSSGNGNSETEIYVGNIYWLETDVDRVDDDTDETPAMDENLSLGTRKYPAFRNSVVDFIKPVITYTYAEGTNPSIDRINEKVSITFDVTDTNFLESNIGKEDIQIFIDEQDVTTLLNGISGAVELDSTAIPAPEIINGIENVGIRYTLTLSKMELEGLINSEIFKRHSGVIRLVIAANQVEDTSGNKNIETTIIVDRGEGAGTLNGELNEYEDLNGNDQLDTGEDEKGIVVDFIDPIIYYQSKYTNWEDRYALITLRATDRFYDRTSVLEDSDLTLYQEKEDGNWINITNQFYDPANGIDKITISTVANDYGEDFVIRLDGFTQEFVMKIVVAAGTKTTDGEGNVTLDGIYDTSNNLNQETEILVDLDNKKPYWKYVRTDTDLTDFDDNTKTGTISFYVDGLDRYLNVTNSILEKEDIQILLNQQDITNADNITVTRLSEDSNYSIDEDANGDGIADEDADGMRSVSYRIDVTGLTEVGIYTMVIAEETLIDDFGNKSAATTISCSRSAIASNTTKHQMVTYHVTPDGEQVHHSYVRELMSVTISGTNAESSTYRPSSLGEIFNNGENPLFSAPMYETHVDGYTVTEVYRPKSFSAWAEADEDGNIIYYTNSSLTTVSGTPTSYTKKYGLYDEIPSTITNLKAIWQNATVIYVSQSAGDDSYDGTKDSPVKTITRAYELLNPSGTAENNIIVIKDAVEWTSTTTITKPAMITSSWAGIDYGVTANAELKISEDMQTTADITFDEIKLYTTSNKLIANYKNVIIGRGVTTPTGKYTFETIVGGNYQTESNTGNIGIHSLRVEVGRYKDIVAGSTLTTSTTTEKFVTHKVVIGNMKDTALSVNDKLIIEGKFVVGENEAACYPNGTTSSNGYEQNYSDVTVYSGTINATDTNNVAIYLKSLNGRADGKVLFNMYGGQINANIYAGSRTINQMSGNLINTMNFYGGTIEGDIYGQGLNSVFIGGSQITLSGIVDITGNVYGGGHAQSGSFAGTGSSTIIMDSSSATVSENIYGGSNGIAGNNNDMEGSSNITITAGKVKNIYGGGNNSGITGSSNITIKGGVISQNIYGGAYNEQVSRTANISILGGTVTGNIYGGNQNTAESQLTSDTIYQNAVIIIGNTTDAIIPTINGVIYGGGIYDFVEKTTITLNECTTITSVYGGSDYNSTIGTADITLSGMTVNEIYGGGKEVGTVGTANIYLISGTAEEVYGGGYKANVTNANINLGITQTIAGEDVITGTADIGTIFGGPNSSGTVTTAKVTLTSGTLDEVYGGGNSANVGTATVTLKGITINEIHGGSKDAGTTTTANVNLISGIVTDVFGGGLDSTVGTTNVTHEGTAEVTTIYGGNDTSTGTGGTVTTTKVKVNSTIANIYGGNYLRGTTQNTNITIHGTSTVTGKLYGGGYKSVIGAAATPGSTTINIAGGTIEGDINGGSEQSIVYGTTNINIGVEALADPASVTYGPIVIEGTIFGAGDSTLAPNREIRDKTLYNYDYVSVQGTTHIKLDNSEYSPITYSGSIFGSGNGATYSPTTSNDTSTVRIKDLGTATDSHELISIERTGTVYIGNSVIELLGRQDVNNTYTRKSYSLNRVTNRLVLHDNSTLYTRRAFNMVGGFASLKTISGTGTETKATYSIDASGIVTKDGDNRLYTFEGINLVFAKVEEVPTGTSTQDLWGDVNGMAFFGMYAIDPDNANAADNKLHDIYDPDYTADDDTTQEFKNGTYVEGRHKSSHNINNDGFYTNVKQSDGTVSPEIIQVTDYGTYYDWIINVEVLDYQIDLYASTYGHESSVEFILGDTDYAIKDSGSFAPSTEYTLNTVSMNPANKGLTLIDPLTVPAISDDANTTFGLTMKTGTTGWVNSSSVNLLATGNSLNGSYSGDNTFKSDTIGTPGSLIFNLYNSINITEQKDLGFVNLVITGKTISNVDGSISNTFKLVIQINIQTILDDLKMQYTPSFAGTVETQKNYTTDSKIDITYLFYKTDVTSTIYASGDYRVLSTSMALPEGTKITLKDDAQGKVYYYHVTSSTTEIKLSDFLSMDSTTQKYEDSGTYYNDANDYIFEKYDVSIDFRDTNIATNQELKEIYLQLRNSSGTVKYDNGDKDIKYSLYKTVDTESAKAEKSFSISNADQTYAVIETINIPIKIDASIIEQLVSGKTVHDTEYYDKISGIAIEVVDGDDRVTLPELQGFKLANANDATEEYIADSSGVIRVPIMESVSTISTDYILSMTQSNVPQGQYTVKVYFFTSDDGKHYGGEETLMKEFYITFINSRLGLIAIDADPDARIISKTTGLNLEGNSGVDMTVIIGDPTEGTNLRVELYKRNTTYTDIEDETTYTGTEYTSVDINDYLDGTWGTVTTAGDGNEYIVVPAGTYESEIGYKYIDFQKALESIGDDGVETGEYKLVFRSYHNDILVQTVTKTFVVSE